MKSWKLDFSMKYCQKAFKGKGRLEGWSQDIQRKRLSGKEKRVRLEDPGPEAEWITSQRGAQNKQKSGDARRNRKKNKQTRTQQYRNHPPGEALHPRSEGLSWKEGCCGFIMQQYLLLALHLPDPPYKNTWNHWLEGSCKFFSPYHSGFLSQDGFFFFGKI